MYLVKRHPLLCDLHVPKWTWRKERERERKKERKKAWGGNWVISKNVALYNETVRAVSDSQECLYCRGCICWLTTVRRVMTVWNIWQNVRFEPAVLLVFCKIIAAVRFLKAFGHLLRVISVQSDKGQAVSTERWFQRIFWHQASVSVLFKSCVSV